MNPTFPNHVALVTAGLLAAGRTPPEGRLVVWPYNLHGLTDHDVATLEMATRLDRAAESLQRALEYARDNAADALDRMRRGDTWIMFSYSNAYDVPQHQAQLRLLVELFGPAFTALTGVRYTDALQLLAGKLTEDARYEAGFATWAAGQLALAREWTAQEKARLDAERAAQEAERAAAAEAKKAARRRR